MSFTLDQNVSGAAAAPQPVAQVSNTSIAAGVVGNLLDVGASFARAQSTPARATQSDRDNAAFKNIVIDIDKRIAAKESLDSISQDVAVDLANLNMNEQQKSIIAQKLGQDIFFVPKQAPSLVDIKIAQFEENSVAFQAGYIQQEVEKAKAKGEDISNEVAAQRAIETYSAFQVAANAGTLQGNIDWNTGYDQNIKTLDSFTATVSAALRVEQAGGNFDIRSLQQMRDAFVLLKSQPAFQKPAGQDAQEKWEVMKGRLDAIDATFTALQDYDMKGATEAATTLMAQIALKDGGSPLAALAFKDPAVMAQIAANATDDLKTAIASDYKPETVDYKALNPDPVVLELMGVSPSGAALSGDGSTPTVPPLDVIFPPEVASAFSERNLVRRARSMTYHSGVIQSIPKNGLTTPEAVNAYASSVTSLAYSLTQNEQQSAKYMDSLFSNSNLNSLAALEAAGGESGRVAANLRAQMGAALQHNQALYGRIAAGRVQTIPGIGIDKETGKFALTNTDDPVFQQLAAVASTYYGGDFEAMWKEGASARTLLKNRLASQGKIEFDRQSYSDFEAATEVLNSSLWKGMSGKYSQVAGIPARLKFFKDSAAKLKVDIGPSALDETTTAPVSSEPQTSPRTEQGTIDNPWVVANEEAYNMVPAGAHYRVGVDPAIRIKRGN